MGSICEDDDQFFDSKEYITPTSDSGSEGPEVSDSESRVFVGDSTPNFGYEIWIRSPGTISERRQKLLKLMGLSPNQDSIEDDDDDKNNKGDSQLCVEEENNVDSVRIMAHSGAVLRSNSQDSSLCSLSSQSSSILCCSSETQELIDRVMLDENLVSRIKNLDDGSEFIVDELGQDGLLRKLREVGSNRLVSGEEFERILGINPVVQRVMRRDAVKLAQAASKNRLEEKRGAKKGWLSKLGVVTHVARANTTMEGSGTFRNSKRGSRSVRVRTSRKRSKELSAVYLGQDMVGHEGAVLTMKFSPDGQLLVSAGEDGVVRVWQVTESERSNLIVPETDQSNVCFVINHVGELVPINNVDKERKTKLKTLRKLSESACVIFPQKVFRLQETPLHEFRGHQGDILDLSWSNNKYLLSSSVDKTVRLWRVGFDQCLKVFSHNTFVTSIQFNPVDENYFISGSIDGKVRIWTIPGYEVVDWTDIKEIVTAVCYKPDGKGAVVGSISGDCYFYDTSDNRLQMTDQTSLHGNKKKPSRRITGFQFSPSDQSKLMVTTADSQVRIIEGANVICKYKGIKNAGSQISASFTSDGAHIVSASEDSFVYVWDSDHHHTNRPLSSHVQSNKSCEKFFSNNVSVAIPWCGGPTCGNVLPSLSHTSSVEHSGITVRYAGENDGSHKQKENPHNRTMPLFLADGFCSDPFSRGAATWPEEKLLDGANNSLTVAPGATRSEFRFLKTTCQNMAGSPHAWGLVIVTAGWDGRIRVFQNYGLPVRL